ncbi:MAG: hypothetical protein AAGD34_06470 [Pseudomonadota bacterium]
MKKTFETEDILRLFDHEYAFPMLDNGYIYLATARLNLFRSDDHWGLVFEIFGYNPRLGSPDISMYTIASEIVNRGRDYDNDEWEENRLKNNPQNEMSLVLPIENMDWMDPECEELVADTGHLVLRGKTLPLPTPADYARAGVEHQEEQPTVFELCRWLAHAHREDVLATDEEKRAHLPSDMQQILLLDDWHHPNLVTGEKPSETQSFQEIAQVLAFADVSLYTKPGRQNTHWMYWPEGGTL